MKARAAGSFRRQAGGVAVVLGLTIALLIGFAALAIDLGRFFVSKTELQNAMDACALAAASQLRPGSNSSDALTRAVAYGQLFSTGGPDNVTALKNRAYFQGRDIDTNVLQITFADTLDGEYRISSQANYNTARYVRCSYALSGLPFMLWRVFEPAAATQTVAAFATATLAPSATTCAIPVAVCIGAGGTQSNNWGLTNGQWLTAAGSSYGTGNFGWVDFSPPGGGASELAALLTGSGQCELATGSRVGEQGQIASLEQAWNSRFGLYKQGGQINLTTSHPDTTGYAYSSENWVPDTDVFSGTPTFPGVVNFVTAETQHRPYQGNVPSGIKLNDYKNVAGVAPLQNALVDYGMTYRRLAVAPVVDCAVWNTSGSAQPEVKDWACVLMLNPMDNAIAPKIEFIRLATAPGSPCATGGLPGGGGPLVPALVQ